MRLLQAVVLAALTAGLAPAVNADDERHIPIDSVVPGMTGTGYTVFQGIQREGFTFKVRSVVPNFSGWPKVIVVELTGCPECTEGGQHMFEHHQILHGMSGSPLYVDSIEGVPLEGGPAILGGLAMSKGFATTTKALVTPIEYQYGMAAALPPFTATPTGSESGDYTATCFVYGDRDSCFKGTMTGRKDGRLFLMSHDISISNDEDLPYGEIRLPVFLIPVQECLQAQDSATKLGGDRIRPLGTASLHGKFGFVVDEGPLPETVPVTLTIHGVYPQPVTVRENMAYHRFAPAALMEILNTVIAQLPFDSEGSITDVVIRLSKPAGTIRFTDSYETAWQRVRSILRNLIVQEKKELRVDSVDISYTPLKQRDYWHPVNISIKGKGKNATLTVIARRAKDEETVQFTELVDAGPLKPYRKKEKTPSCWDGATFQDYLFNRIPVREAMKTGLLDRIQDREALYCFYGEQDKDMKASPAGGSRKQRLPEIKVLLNPKLEGARFYIERDDNNSAHAVLLQFN